MPKEDFDLVARSELTTGDKDHSEVVGTMTISQHKVKGWKRVSIRLLKGIEAGTWINGFLNDTFTGEELKAAAKLKAAGKLVVN